MPMNDNKIILKKTKYQNLSKFRFVRFLKQLPDELPGPGDGAGAELVHLLLLLLLVPGQVLLHPVEGVLAAGLQVQVVWNNHQSVSQSDKGI